MRFDNNHHEHHNHDFRHELHEQLHHHDPRERGGRGHGNLRHDHAPLVGKPWFLRRHADPPGSARSLSARAGAHKARGAGGFELRGALS